MQKTWSLKSEQSSDWKWLNDKWQAMFKKTAEVQAEVIVGKVYDHNKIKGDSDKNLVVIVDNGVNLEVAKALVYVTGKIGGPDHEHCRKTVDAMTNI